MAFVPQPCAEFPNDNPDLHDGAVWVCSWPRAHARAVMRASGTARFGNHAARAAAAPELWTIVYQKPRPFLALRPWCLADQPIATEFVGPEESLSEHELLVAESEHAVPAPTRIAIPQAGMAPAAPIPGLVAAQIESVLIEAQTPASLLDSPPPPLAQPVETPQLPAVAEIEDPFVQSLWQELEAAGDDAERLAQAGGSDEQSPVPISQLRLFRPEPAEAELTWDELQPLDLDLSPLPRDSEWVRFTTQLSRYLLDRGATRAASVIVPLLEGQRVNLRSLSGNARTLLKNLSVCEETSQDLFTTPVFQREAQAFYQLFLSRAEAAGARHWLSQLVFALLAGAHALDEIRQDFGLIRGPGEELALGLGVAPALDSASDRTGTE